MMPAARPTVYVSATSTKHSPNITLLGRCNYIHTAVLQRYNARPSAARGIFNRNPPTQLSIMGQHIKVAGAKAKKW